MTHTVLYDPYGRIEDLPLDREPHEKLLRAVLAWAEPGSIRPTDCAQIALQLTGHARLVAAALRLQTSSLPAESGRRALAEAILGEAARRLSGPVQDTVQCCQNRARLLRALYERLDRLHGAASAPVQAPPSELRAAPQ
ncbi:restriction endonuclease [Streptomyces sp. NPDC048516]|uniref:restriction endonuclease n=1 Tax=Streptomyces sp. NPDC048516 TaxID=3365565 RepID=UPI003714B90C